MNTVMEGWLSYLSDVVPEEAGEAQIIETKRAFYAGAFHMLTAVTEIGADAVTEEQGVKQIEKLKEECLEFKKNVVRRA